MFVCIIDELVVLVERTMFGKIDLNAVGSSCPANGLRLDSVRKSRDVGYLLFGNVLSDVHEPG